MRLSALQHLYINASILTWKLCAEIYWPLTYQFPLYLALPCFPCSSEWPGDEASGQTRAFKREVNYDSTSLFEHCEYCYVQYGYYVCTHEYGISPHVSIGVFNSCTLRVSYLLCRKWYKKKMWHIVETNCISEFISPVLFWCATVHITTASTVPWSCMHVAVTINIMAWSVFSRGFDSRAKGMLSWTSLTYTLFSSFPKSTFGFWALTKGV